MGLERVKISWPAIPGARFYRVLYRMKRGFKSLGIRGNGSAHTNRTLETLQAKHCADTDASVEELSGGMVRNCTDAGMKGLCLHAEIGVHIRALCQLTCGLCKSAMAGRAKPTLSPTRAQMHRRDGMAHQQNLSWPLLSQRSEEMQPMSLNTSYNTAEGTVMFEWQAHGSAKFYTVWQRDTDTDVVSCVPHDEMVPSNSSHGMCARFVGLRSAAFVPKAARLSMTSKGACKTKRIEYFILGCWDSSLASVNERINCDLSNPSTIVKLRFECKGKIYSSNQVSNRGRVQQLQGCIINDRIEISLNVCRDVTEEYSGWKCMAESGNEGTSCLTTYKAEVEQYLYPCHHSDQFVYRPIACLDSACNLQRHSMEIMEYAFQHKLGSRMSRCGTLPPKWVLDASMYTNSANSAAIAGVIAAHIAGQIAAQFVSQAASPLATNIANLATAGNVQVMLAAIQFLALTGELCSVTYVSAMCSDTSTLQMRYSHIWIMADDGQTFELPIYGSQSCSFFNPDCTS